MDLTALLDFDLKAGKAVSTAGTKRRQKKEMPPPAKRSAVALVTDNKLVLTKSLDQLENVCVI